MPGQLTLAFTQHAAERAAAKYRIDLRRGAASLRAIAFTAPLLGLLGTTVMLKTLFRAYSFPGFDSWDCAGGMADTYIPLLLSLPVSLFARFAYHELRQHIESLEFEMQEGIFGLLVHLAQTNAKIHRRSNSLDT